MHIHVTMSTNIFLWGEGRVLGRWWRRLDVGLWKWGVGGSNIWSCNRFGGESVWTFKELGHRSQVWNVCRNNKITLWYFSKKNLGLFTSSSFDPVFFLFYWRGLSLGIFRISISLAKTLKTFRWNTADFHWNPTQWFTLLNLDKSTV